LALNPADDDRVTGSGRLDGWKDIASCLNRSVRTVQRWEAQLGLPIRRKGAPGGEIVYAFRGEIDAWLRTDGGRHAHAASTDDDARTVASAGAEPADVTSVPPSPRLSARFVTVAALLCLALFVTVWSVYPSSSGRGGAPARWEPTERGLRLLDVDRQPVCEVEFGVPFDLDLYQRHPDSSRLAADLRGYHMVHGDEPVVEVADVDGDGRRDAVVLLRTLDEMRTSLRVYDHACTLRWEYSPRPDVRFGGTSFAPPFPMLWVAVSPAGGGAHDIWLSRRHQREFPSVLAKVSSRGQLLGEYWHPGEIKVAEVGRLSGREVVVVGGVNNERRQAFLTVLQKEPFGGVGPAEQEQYRCTGCAPGAPALGYVLFPDSELARLRMGMSSVAEIRLHGSWLSVNVLQNAGTDGQSSVPAFTAYELRPDLTPARFEYSDGYRWVHDRMHEAGRVAARFDPAQAPSLVPLVAWDGHGFRQQSRVFR